MDDPKLRERIEAAIDMAWHTEYVYGAQGEEPERTLDIEAAVTRIMEVVGPIRESQRALADRLEWLLETYKQNTRRFTYPDKETCVATLEGLGHATALVDEARGDQPENSDSRPDRSE